MITQAGDPQLLTIPHRLLWGKTGRLMTGLPSGDEDGHVGSPEQTLSLF